MVLARILYMEVLTSPMNVKKKKKSVLYRLITASLHLSSKL